jgi:hypothetical protein
MFLTLSRDISISVTDPGCCSLLIHGGVEVKDSGDQELFIAISNPKVRVQTAQTRPLLGFVSYFAMPTPTPTPMLLYFQLWEIQ